MPLYPNAMPFRLTLIADDYAIAPGVSRGIREALAAGRLSGTGCMTNMPGWAREAAALRAFDGQAQIGLHLNLTTGKPLSAMPVLAPGGLLPPIARLMRGRLPPEEIRGEIAAQLDAFARHFGRAPDFVDGHQHVQVLAGVAGPLLAELGARGLAGKIWLRNSADRLDRIFRRRVSLIKALGLAFLARHFAGQARAAGFVTNAGFSGFSDFNPEGDYEAEFARSLVSPGKSHLVMCHPGHDDAKLAAIDEVTLTREHELAFLLSDRFVEVLKAAGAELNIRR